MVSHHSESDAARDDVDVARTFHFGQPVLDGCSSHPKAWSVGIMRGGKLSEGRLDKGYAQMVVHVVRWLRVKSPELV